MKAPPLHYMERLAREYEDAYLEEILADFERGFAGREHKTCRTATQTPSVTRTSRGKAATMAAPRPAKPRDCHKGVRAPRLVGSTADLAAHPELFRCPECGRLLDAPKPPSPLTGRRWGKVGDRVLDLLAGDVHRFGEIARGAGLTNSHAYNELARLIRYGIVERYGRGLYRLTENQPALAARPARKDSEGQKERKSR